MYVVYFAGMIFCKSCSNTCDTPLHCECSASFTVNLWQSTSVAVYFSISKSVVRSGKAKDSGFTDSSFIMTLVKTSLFWLRALHTIISVWWFRIWSYNFLQLQVCKIIYLLRLHKLGGRVRWEALRGSKIRKGCNQCQWLPPRGGRTLGVRYIIPEGARKVRLHIRKLPCLSLSCGFFVFFCKVSEASKCLFSVVL